MQSTQYHFGQSTLGSPEQATNARFLPKILKWIGPFLIYFKQFFIFALAFEESLDQLPVQILSNFLFLHSNLWKF